ncbi:hypothetical protein ACFW4X_13875 [Streptomyces smyrnaeus]|uniref:hypothetical protein n=1 Tax=Streptomyces smyrnaeus TaxID=1387713 RepID=UPI003685F686
MFVGDTLTDRTAAFEADVTFAEADCPVVLADPVQIGPGLLDLVPAGRAPQRVSAAALRAVLAAEPLQLVLWQIASVRWRSAAAPM